MFVSVEKAAQELGFAPQTVRNRIADGSLRAIQGVRGGAYRVPVMEIEAFKRRHGMAPAIKTAAPSGIIITSAEQIYEQELVPVMKKLGAQTPEQALQLFREQDDPIAFSAFLSAYSFWAESIRGTAVVPPAEYTEVTLGA